MKLTSFERGWIRIITGLSFVIAAVFLTLPLLNSENHAPLADTSSLKTLINGHVVTKPTEEYYGEFLGNKVNPPPLTLWEQTNDIMGVSQNVPPSLSDFKRIEVDLTNQKVYAFEGNTKIHEFIVSTGKWGRTPTGEFRIWAKVKSQKMEGGSKEKNTYYYLPNVPYVMFFSNNEITKMRGFSFHGTYWHSNFGTPMSHGCVNMRTEEAKVLYEWATPMVTNGKAWSTLANDENPGTKVIVYGVTPRE